MSMDACRKCKSNTVIICPFWYIAWIGLLIGKPLILLGKVITKIGEILAALPKESE